MPLQRRLDVCRHARALDRANEWAWSLEEGLGTRLRARAGDMDMLTTSFHTVSQSQTSCESLATRD